MRQSTVLLLLLIARMWKMNWVLYPSTFQQQLRRKLQRANDELLGNILPHVCWPKQVWKTAGRQWKLSNWRWPVPKICEWCLSSRNKLEQWPKKFQNIIGPTNDGLYFAQAAQAEEHWYQDSPWPNNHTEFFFKEMGHKSYECPNNRAPTANAATAPNKTAVNHVHISSGASSDSDDDDNNLEF